MEQIYTPNDRKLIRNKVASLIVILIFLLTVGTIAYSNIEGWSILDSLYFSTVTLATVGYGDFTPHTTLGKLFTIPFIISGVAMVLYALSILGTYYITYLEEKRSMIHQGVSKAWGHIDRMTKKKPDKWVTLRIKENLEKKDPREDRKNFDF